MTDNADSTPAAEHRWHRILRDFRVVIVTLTTGALDATTFLLLGKVFSSVITGNLVLLGVSAATASSAEAVHSGLALAGYAAGVAVGARLVAGGEPRAIWPRSVTVTLGVELCVLVAFCVGWELSHGRPGGAAQLALLVLAAAAMGMRSTAIRKLGQMSTTYLTSTLTGVVGSLAIGKVPDAVGRSTGVIVTMIIGAVVGGTLAIHAYAWLPAIILLPLALVIAAAIAEEDPPAGAGQPAGGGR
jgi:uncharacterized membrane protein YoaK (UPF0700 family)